jgi:hypothetical protein
MVHLAISGYGVRLLSADGADLRACELRARRGRWAGRKAGRRCRGAATRAFVAKDQASPYSGRAHVSCLKVEPPGYRVQERGWPTTR